MVEAQLAPREAAGNRSPAAPARHGKSPDSVRPAPARRMRPSTLARPSSSKAINVVQLGSREEFHARGPPGFGSRAPDIAARPGFLAKLLARNAVVQEKRCAISPRMTRSASRSAAVTGRRRRLHSVLGGPIDGARGHRARGVGKRFREGGEWRGSCLTLTMQKIFAKGRRHDREIVSDAS